MAFSDALVGRAVPTHSFYHEESLESDEAQTSFTLLRLLVNPDDRVGLRWWLGHGSPSWRKGEYAKLRQHCEATGLSPKAALDQIVAGTLKPNGMKGIVDQYKDLTNRLAAMAAMSCPELVDHLLPSGSDSAKVLSDAATLALPDVETPKELLERLAEGITQPEMPEEGEFVRIMSLHKSKGLTSKAVVVAGCIEGLIPNSFRNATPDLQEAMLKEQRRLFYVAATRCREILALSSVTRVPRDLAYRIGAVTRWGTGTVTSRFIDELGPTRPIPKAGDTWRASGFV